MFQEEFFWEVKEVKGVGLGAIWSYLEFLKFSGVMQTTILDGNVFNFFNFLNFFNSFLMLQS